MWAKVSYKMQQQPITFISFLLFVCLASVLNSTTLASPLPNNTNKSTLSFSKPIQTSIDSQASIVAAAHPTTVKASAKNKYFTVSNSSLTAPKGATLVDWSPCSSDLIVPAFINDKALQGDKSPDTVYVVQHGHGSKFDQYFTSLYNVVGDTAAIISPGFLTDDGVSEYYKAGTTMAWSSDGDSWDEGDDDTTGANCSSMDMHNSIIDYYAKSGSFKGLKKIVIVSHSGGANLISRFSQINENEPVDMRYIIASAADQGYFTHDRPVNKTCDDGPYSYPYQWAGKTNRFVSKYFTSDEDATKLYRRWKSRDIVQIVGDKDTELSGTQSCKSQLQGGKFRRDRMYAYWAYDNLLAGTKTDVSKFTGYDEFLKQGVKPISSSGDFNHQQCTVAGAHHDQDELFPSDCGKAAILGGKLPDGAGASYPST